jgi:hypothetical protein
VRRAAASKTVVDLAVKSNQLLLIQCKHPGVLSPTNRAALLALAALLGAWPFGSVPVRSGVHFDHFDGCQPTGSSPGERTTKPIKIKPGDTSVTNPGSTTTPKYQIGDIVQWSHDSERVATGTIVSTVVSHNRGPLHDVEIHFNPGLFLEKMSEDQLKLVHPDILRETLETIQAALKALDAGRSPNTG